MLLRANQFIVHKKDQLIHFFKESVQEKDRDKIIKIADQIREEWKKEGILLGMEQGMEKGQFSIIHSMLKRELSIPEIASITGLSENKIKSFKKKFH